MSARPPGPRKRLAGLGGTWRVCPPRVAVCRPAEYTPSPLPDNDPRMHDTNDAPGADHAATHTHAHEDEHADGRPRIAFVGAGRVGTTLGVAFARAGWEVTAVASRNAERRERFRQMVPGARGFADGQGVLDEAELIFLTVPDDA